MEKPVRPWGLMPVQSHQPLSEGSQCCGCPRQRLDSGRRSASEGQAEARERERKHDLAPVSARHALCFLLSTQMKKVMLTVFKHNHGAYQFFREALQ